MESDLTCWGLLNATIDTGMPLIQLLSMIAWFVYVVLTHRTLAEIRSQTAEIRLQTEAQTRGWLNVTPKVEPFAGLKRPTMNGDVETAHGAYRSQLERTLPEAVTDSEGLVLHLENLGKSALVGVTIRAKLTVSPGEFLASQAVGVKTVTWEVCEERVIRPGDTISVFLAPVGCFPRAEFEFEYSFRDLIGVDPRPASGPAAATSTNPLALQARVESGKGAAHV